MRFFMQQKFQNLHSKFVKNAIDLILNANEGCLSTLTNICSTRWLGFCLE